jgi:hypothetical protein
VTYLRLLDIIEPLREEGRHVGIEGGCPGIDLCVSHPAETLVALRAIGRHLDEVGPLRPRGVLPKLCHHRIAAGEAPGGRHVIGEDEADEHDGSGVIPSGKPLTSTY